MEYKTIEIPRWITRAFISQHRKDLIFIFSDDLNGQHYVGQASQCKGEPNCYSVPTKKLMCMEEGRAFFDDARFELLWKPAIDKAIEKIPRDKPIIPFPRMGLGDAKLLEKAPKTYEYLMGEINKIAYKNIQWTNL
jgi:hypothetical protein